MKACRKPVNLGNYRTIIPDGLSEELNPEKGEGRDDEFLQITHAYESKTILHRVLNTTKA
jgi:hypothetical protein